MTFPNMRRALFHIFFLGAIAYLAFKNHRADYWQSQLDFMVVQALDAGQLAKPRMLEARQLKLKAVEKGSMESETSTNKEYVRRAHRIIALARDFECSLGKSFKCTKELAAKTAVCRDTLTKLVDGERDFSAILGPVFRTDSADLERIFSDFQPRHFAIAEELLQSEVMANSMAALNYCERKVSPQLLDGYYFVPMAIFKTINPKVGERAEADFLFALFEGFPKYKVHSFSIDGKRLPIKDGKAPFAKKFKAPGLQKLRAACEVLIVNDSNHFDTLRVEREFEVNVPETAHF